MVSFTCYDKGVKAIGPQRVAVFNKLVPICEVELAAVPGRVDSDFDDC
jgi:hypothetical protein